MNNTIKPARFEQFVTALKQTTKRQYDRSVNKDLSRQNWRDLFIRNVTAVLNEAYAESLAQLQRESFDFGEVETENGFSNTLVQALKPFDGFVEELIQYALQKHRTSCALSNFPDEHKPSEEYIDKVILQTTKDWQTFVLQVNTIVSLN